ncbi:MAG TPA: M20 family metallopeptidase [Puia sp.]|nr:M20 family metallopeptidase [Puia sp.]
MEERLFDKLVRVRRRLHQIPELGFQEFKTAAFLQAELEALQIPVERVLATGLIGVLRKGAGPTVVLRADMDALPVLEGTNLPFKSLTDGCAHACGHDLHMTILLGAAHLLNKADFNGTIKFLFQPSEESALRSPEKGKSGGQLVAESGALKDADVALGLHVHPLLPVGDLGYKIGESFANVGNFAIRIHGNGGHPGDMRQVIDPVLVAGHLITEARGLAGPQPDPPMSVLAFAHVETLAKPSFNVIPSDLLLQGSLRSLYLDVYNELVEKLQELLRKLETRFGCRIELEFTAYYPSLWNDEQIHTALAPVREKIFGHAHVIESRPYLIGEDFAFYSRMMPAQFYLLGAKTEENDSFFLHHPQVTFHEDCIRYGSTFLADSALQLLKAFAGQKNRTRPEISRN